MTHTRYRPRSIIRSSNLAALFAIAALGPLLFFSRTVRAEAPSSTPTLPSSDPDPWFGPDKALHFTASLVLASGGYAVGTALFSERWKAFALGGGVALAAGAAKEGLDAAGLGDPSWRDFAWDVIGTAAGLAIAYSVDWASKGSPPPLGTARASLDGPTAAPRLRASPFGLRFSF